ncbi:MAG: choice-of-anchor Q domain-containing protein, partial [Sphingobacteriia bacterium]
FEYCLLKADVFEAGSGTNQFNQDPLFQAPRNRLFAPLAGSPLINAGSPLTATTTDLLDQAARGILDIGAIEGP